MNEIKTAVAAEVEVFLSGHGTRIGVQFEDGSGEVFTLSPEVVEVFKKAFGDKS